MENKLEERLSAIEKKQENLEKKLDLILKYLFTDGKIKNQDDTEENKMYSVEEKLEKLFNYLEIDDIRSTPGVVIKRV